MTKLSNNPGSKRQQVIEEVMTPFLEQSTEERRQQINEGLKRDFAQNNMKKTEKGSDQNTSRQKGSDSLE